MNFFECEISYKIDRERNVIIPCPIRVVFQPGPFTENQIVFIYKVNCNQFFQNVEKILFLSRDFLIALVELSRGI